VLTHRCYKVLEYVSQYSNWNTGWVTGIKVSFQAEVRVFSLLCSTQTSSGNFPGSYPIEIEGSFPCDKMDEA
jgi:hypothetical protein